MNQDQPNDCAYVSSNDATRALESLGNLIFLTAQSANNPEQVRRFMIEAESCVTMLVRFTKRSSAI